MQHRLKPATVFSSAICLLGLAAAPAAAQGAAPKKAEASPQRPADPAQLPDQELGRRFTIKAEDLPPPKTGPLVASRTLTIAYQGQTPRVLEGFTATAFATGLEHPRRLLVLPNGDVIVAEQRTGHLTLLRDQDGDGKAEWMQRYAEGFNGPYGLAWRNDHVLVADQDGVWTVPHRLGALRAGRSEQQKVEDVPPEQRKPSPALVGERMITAKGVFGIVQGHANRHLAIDPKSGGLFVGVGSAGNIGVEPERQSNDPALRCRRIKPEHVRVGPAQRHGAGVPAGQRRSLRRRARARRARRPPAAGLPDAR